MKPLRLFIGRVGGILSALVLLLAGPHARGAGPYNVNTTSDTHAANASSSPNDSTGHVSLRSAIEAANVQSGAVTINVPAGTYNLSLGEIDLAPGGDRTEIITGAGSASTIVNQTDGVNRVFNVDFNSDGGTVTTFSGLTIQGGTDATDQLGGAGILAGSEGATPEDILTLNNCVIQHNHCTTLSTEEEGGGIQMAAGNLNVTGCTFANNSSGASLGGAIYILDQSVNSDLNVTNTVFTGNGMTNNSGAGPDGGGAIMIETTAGSVHNLIGCTFTNNRVVGLSGDTYGGAIQINGGTLNIIGSTFVNNSVSGQGGLGGAIYGDSGTVNVAFCRLVGNSASVSGGAIYNHGSNGDHIYATNDWWGCNGGPGATGCDLVASDTAGTLISSTWLILTNTASPGTINAGQSATLTASILRNSAGQTLTAAQAALLPNLPLTWENVVNGGLTGAQTAIQANGQATATFNNTACGSGGASVVLDDAVAAASLFVNCPDLTLTKVNNVGGLTTPGNGWTWTLHVANTGPAPATFQSGNTITLDDLPVAGVAYGTPTVANLNGVTGTLVSGVNASTNLTVTASGTVTVGAGGSFDLMITATAATTGTYGNPRSGGVCVVNPNNSVPETNAANNFASNSVVVTCPAITGTVSGNSSVCEGTPANVTVTVSGGVPPYSVTLNNGGGTQTGSSPFAFTVNPAATTTYGLSAGTDSQGCPISGGGSATVAVNPLSSVITLSPASILANSAGNQAAAPAGLSSYAWSIRNGIITGPTNQATITYFAGTSNNVVLSLTVANASGCTAGNVVSVPLITGFSVHTNVTFTDALAVTTTALAFDGTNYWSASGGSAVSVRLAAYGLSGAVSNTYSPGLDFRSLTTTPNGALLARAYGSGLIYTMTSPGGFTGSAVTLTGGTLDPQAAVVLNGPGTEFDAQSGGVVSRWSTNGTYIGAVNLIGFGSLAGEASYPQSRGLAVLGEFWLTYNGAGVVSLWDAGGHRVTELALPGAGTSNDSDFGFSYCNGKVFIVDVAGGTWRGFDLYGAATVAVLAAETNTAWNSDVTNKIAGVGSLPGVDLIPVASPAPIPTPAQLRAFQSVLVFSDESFTDPVAMGNVLSDYINQGGGVVVQTSALAADVAYGLQGRILNNGDLPFTFTTPGVGSAAGLSLVVEQPSSPLLDGVNSFSGGRLNSPLGTNAATAVAADWSNGQPLVGGQDDRPGRCAGLNFFPPSSDASAFGWASGTGGAQLMADALLWSGRIPPTLLVAPADQVLPAGATANFAVVAAGTSPLSYQWQLNGAALPAATNRTLSVIAGPGTEGAYSVVVSNLYGATTSLNARLNPPLSFLPPVATGGLFSLYLANADTTPLATNRAARVTLYATTNLALPPAQWWPLTNPVVPAGTQLRADGFSTTNDRNLFIKAVEIP